MYKNTSFMPELEIGSSQVISTDLLFLYIVLLQEILFLLISQHLMLWLQYMLCNINKQVCDLNVTDKKNSQQVSSWIKPSSKHSEVRIQSQSIQNEMPLLLTTSKHHKLDVCQSFLP